MDTVPITDWLGTADELAAVGEVFCCENEKMTRIMIAAVSAAKGKKRLVRLCSPSGNVLAIVKECDMGRWKYDA